MRRSFVFIIACALAGCVSTGNRIDVDRLSEVVKGKSTIEDVIGRFGQPTSRVRSPDGEQTLVYLSRVAQPDAATFIPLVGTLAGSVDTTTHSVIFQFDAKGVLTDYKVHDATVNNKSEQQAAPK
ncbi:MAG TPA: hypothetical protein VMT94_01655 [Burkholderiales bacterium]|nr:hypothetical protein [Burkholderiales bacterium]